MKVKKSYQVYLFIYSGSWPYLIQLRLLKPEQYDTSLRYPLNKSTFSGNTKLRSHENGKNIFITRNQSTG